MATQSSILAWIIPWTEEPGELQSMELQRVWHDWTHTHTHTHKYHYNPIHNSKWIQFSHSVVSDSLWPHGLQHARFPCPSPTSGAYSNSCPLTQWCHPTISFSVIPFSSCLWSFPASRSFQMSQFFTSGGQSIGVSASASVLPMNIQDWSPLEWTGWISLLSKGLSRVFSSTTAGFNNLLIGFPNSILDPQYPFSPQSFKMQIRLYLFPA